LQAALTRTRAACSVYENYLFILMVEVQARSRERGYEVSPCVWAVVGPTPPTYRGAESEESEESEESVEHEPLSVMESLFVRSHSMSTHAWRLRVRKKGTCL